MINSLKTLFAVAVAATMAACSTTALDKNATTVDWSKGSIVLMTMSMTNDYRTNFPPTRLGVVLGKSTDPRFLAIMSSPVQNGTNTSLISQQVPAGNYVIKRITGGAGSFPIMGQLDFTVDAPFVIPPRSVAYLGHLTLLNKEKVNKDDQSTGGALPLIDQAVAGFSGGTLEITLQDNFDEDMVQLRKEYPALQGVDAIRMPVRKLSVARAMGSNSPVIVVYQNNANANKSNSMTVEDVDAVPNLSDNGKTAYREWLRKPNPKAFILGPGSKFASAWGTHPKDINSPADPIERALALCKKNTGVDCKPYAINDTVVWVSEIN